MTFQKLWNLKYSWLEYNSFENKVLCNISKEDLARGLLTSRTKNGGAYTEVGFLIGKMQLQDSKSMKEVMLIMKVLLKRH